ncbi:MAG: CheR family methyltransferase [Planctomycetota bacterium]
MTQTTDPAGEGAELRRFLEASTGFQIPEDRWGFLEGRFLARLEGRGFSGVAGYVDYLRHDPVGRNELEELFSLLTVRKTSFFRNPSSFDALAQEVLPKLAARGAGTLSVWSAGCSTGEEPYSIAMVAETVLGGLGRGFYVLASDIVKEALERARRGVYPTAAVSGIPAEYRHHLRGGGGHVEVAAELRTRVDFVEHNLVHDAAPRAGAGGWDVIFCRNVFIYFGEEQARSVLRRFHAALSPGGVLFLGHAEVFPGLEQAFDVVFWGDTYYYRRREDPRVAPVRAPVAPVTKPLPRLAPPPEPPGSGAGLQEVTRSYRRPSPNTTTQRRRRLSDSSASWRAGDTPTRAYRREEGGPRPYDLLAQAESLRVADDLEGSARALRAAISRAPRWARPRVELARLLRQRGELDQAAREADSACDAEPLHTEAHVLLGELRAALGDHARAEVCLRRALYLDPQRLDARWVLASSFRARRQPDRACRELRAVIRALRDPGEGKLTLPEGFTEGALTRACQAEIDDMGGSLADSGVWPVPPG